MAMNLFGVRIASLIAFVLLLVVVPAAQASKGRPGPGGGSPPATLYASCNPCAVGSTAHFWGSGYDPNQGAQLWITYGFGSAVPVAADGSVSFDWYMSAAGTYDVRLYQSGKGGKLILKGEVITYAK